MCTRHAHTFKIQFGSSPLDAMVLKELYESRSREHAPVANIHHRESAKLCESFKELYESRSREYAPVANIPCSTEKMQNCFICQ
jgi:hypothetical protein